MVKKIRNIIVGWWRKLFSDSPVWVNQRREICNKCQHMTSLGKTKWCTLCWCEIYAKTAVEDEICYDGRWNDIKINDHDE